MRSPRLWVAVLMMTITALVLQVRGDVDHAPPSRPLDQIPTRLDGRTATEYPLDPETLAVLGNGDFLNRIYNAPDGEPTADPAVARLDAQSAVQGGTATAASVSQKMPISLFIGYFATQRTGQAIHSPQHCLPGAGWTFLSSGVTAFTDATGKTYNVGDYLITDGKTQQEVLYWYQMHGRSIASDYRAKLDTVIDSIRLGRTDAALVRVITPLAPGEDRAEARARAIQFARDLTPMLPAFVPN